MESKKNTFQIVLTCILAVLVLVLAAALYRSWKMAGDLQRQLAEAQNNILTVESAQASQEIVSADNSRTVRVMNGMLQQQDATGQWVDVAPVEELQQADPVLAGKNKMQELIAQNREKVQNGTMSAEQIAPLLSKQNALEGTTLASTSQVQSATEKAASQQAKPANNAVTSAAPVTTAAPAQQPAADNNNSNDNGGSDNNNSSDNGGSNNTGADNGEADNGGSDNGSVDNGSDSSDSGDGEDVGWTDEVL